LLDAADRTLADSHDPYVLVGAPARSDNDVRTRRSARPKSAKTGVISRLVSGRHAVRLLLGRRSMRLMLNLLAGLMIVWSLPALATAQDAPPQVPRVRPEEALRELVDEAARRSETVRDLIDRLEHMDVVVYIRTRAFMPSDLDGRVALLAKSGHRRFLVIELARERSTIVQMSTLGHELFHATEIAAEPSIVNARTLEEHYSSIGKRTSSTAGHLTFETEAAAHAGERTRQELLNKRVRSVHGT
jgi:hypothetical protein